MQCLSPQKIFILKSDSVFVFPEVTPLRQRRFNINQVKQITTNYEQDQWK